MDSWGVDGSQCVMPGYHPIPQPVAIPATSLLSGYPGTLDQALHVCNQAVFTSPLVDAQVQLFSHCTASLYCVKINDSKPSS